MARLAFICGTCRQIVPKGQRCPRCTPTEAERNERQPYRRAYADPDYKRNRLARYRLAGGLCEACGIQLKGELREQGEPWQSDHVTEASKFADPRQANDIGNLRVYCTTRAGRKGCHAGKRKPRR